jgi:hypothetical protein
MTDGVQKISKSGMHKELLSVGLFAQKQERLYIYIES